MFGEQMLELAVSGLALFRRMKLILFIKGNQVIMHILKPQYNASLICNIHTPPHVSAEILFSKCLYVCPSVPSNMSVALNLCFSCYLRIPSQNSFIRKKTCHAPNTVTFQHDSSIRTKRATV